MQQKELYFHFPGGREAIPVTIVTTGGSPCRTARLNVEARKAAERSPERRP